MGIGTVFRHFPAKESLIEAVFTELMRRLADEADALVAAADVGVPELVSLMVGMSKATEAAPPDVRSRTFQVVFDGLRAPGGA
ncbi:hypothetical protein Pta02_09680 [Planobispora takensis]|uniref:Transcriptional regulator SbtR-like C-terminal domain-containing protein n=1 Tax=Planobispora takensis TaxID=1367882 RepID=A0A8J3WQJ6_9ACTN|nr:hypothetical protein [Planobispora takensis]GIH98959.1 hypothetical protein Pta02_09680 [Planobispora takensis]